MGLTTLSIGLLVGAVAMVGYPFYTNLLQDRIQSRLDRQIASPELRQAYLDRNIGIGDSLTRIIIPDLDVDVVVVEGTTASALRAGAGHYPDTPLPVRDRQRRHRRPPHDLRPSVPQHGSAQTGYGDHPPDADRRLHLRDHPGTVRRVAKQVEVVANTPDEATLTLTTCHPKGSARQRLIVKATLVRSNLETDPA